MRKGRKETECERIKESRITHTITKTFSAIDDVMHTLLTLNTEQIE